MDFPTYSRSPYPSGSGLNAWGQRQAARNAYDAAQQAWQAQQDAAEQNSTRVALEQELARNESEISELQLELENIRTEWEDLDSVDRKLAANRAAIGDFGNARAHQTDIVNRRNEREKRADTEMQWRWQAEQNRLSREADQKKQAKADINRIRGEIDDIDAQLPYHTEIGAKNALMAKRKRLVSELASYGVSIQDGDGVQWQGQDGVGTDGKGQGSDSVANLTQDEASYTDKNGYFLDARKREDIAKRYNNLNLKSEAKRVRNTRTVQEVATAKKQAEAEKEEARRLVARHQQMTEAQRAVFLARWNRNDPNDREIQLLRKYATYDGKNGPTMK